MVNVQNSGVLIDDVQIAWRKYLRNDLLTTMPSKARSFGNEKVINPGRFFGFEEVKL